MKHHSQYFLIWLFASIVLGLFCLPATADDSHITLKGTVTDEFLKPVPNVQIKLTSLDEGIHGAAKTNAQGKFNLKHPTCKEYCLAVTPPKDSRLAAAWLDNLSGEENRSMVIELQHGFTIYGRVAHANKGLKGLTVAVRPANRTTQGQDFVHGGGWAQTNGDGRFEMTLTNGPKELTIINKQYSDLTSSWSRDLTIHGEGVLEEIDLPLAQDQSVKTGQVPR